MEPTIKKNKPAIVLGTLLLASFISLSYLFVSNSYLNNKLNDEKLKNELMLSEKLSLNKEVEDYSLKINSLNRKNEELEELIDNTTKQLNIKIAEAVKLNQENGKVQSLKKQLANLNKLKKENEIKILALNEKINLLTRDNEFLNQSLTLLTDENKQLSANLALLSAITADNYLLEATKKSGRLTVVAKRTKKLAVNFKVPENMTESISFKLIKPDGVIIDGKSKELTLNISEYNELIFADNSKGEIKISKKIEMTYQPKEKLKFGLYKVEIYNKEKYIGSCNVKLR